MSKSSISTTMFIIAFLLFVVGILTIFDTIGNTLSTVLIISLFVISVIVKGIEYMNEKSEK